MTNKVAIPKVLPISPITLTCPYCEAEPGKDCAAAQRRQSVRGFPTEPGESERELKAEAEAKAAEKPAAAKAPKPKSCQAEEEGSA